MSTYNHGDTVLVVKHTPIQTVDTAVMTSNGSTSFSGDSNIMPFNSDLHCSRGDLLGPLGLFVQGLLAFIAFASLIGKFDRDSSLRPKKVLLIEILKMSTYLPVSFSPAKSSNHRLGPDKNENQS